MNEQNESSDQEKSITKSTKIAKPVQYIIYVSINTVQIQIKLVWNRKVNLVIVFVGTCFTLCDAEYISHVLCYVAELQ